jgi:hypothetical protein
VDGPVLLSPIIASAAMTFSSVSVIANALRLQMEHSPTSATGTAWERTPWHETQRAAWDALRTVSI